MRLFAFGLACFLSSPGAPLAGESRLLDLTGAETARHVHLSWSRPGTPTPVALDPVENLSLRASAVHQDARDGQEDAAERGAVPLNALDALWAQMVQDSGLFVLDERVPRYRLSLTVTDYRPRYASDSAGWLGSGLEWSKAFLGLGDTEASQASLRLFVYDAGAASPSLSLELRGGLRPCETVDFAPATKAGSEADAFLNTYARTPIGQTVHALMNRALAELSTRVAPDRPHGRVLAAERGEVWLDLEAAETGETVQLLHPAERPYPIGRLVVTGGEPGRYRATPRDLPVAAIVAGDTVVRERLSPSAVYTSLPAGPDRCVEDEETQSKEKRVSDGR